MHPIVLAVGGDVHCHGRISVQQCIGQQRTHRAGEPRPIPAADESIGDRALQVAIAVLAAKSERACPVGGVIHELAQVDAIGPQRQLPRADARSVEEGLEHVAEPVGLIDNRREPALRRLGIAAIDLALRHLC